MTQKCFHVKGGLKKPTSGQEPRLPDMVQGGEESPFLSPQNVKTGISPPTKKQPCHSFEQAKKEIYKELANEGEKQK